MIDRATVSRLTLISAILFLVTGGLALALWNSWSIAGGLAAGFALGLAPFLSWAWIAVNGLSTPSRRALSVILVVGKLGLYAGFLYLVVTRKLVDPVAVMVGITLVVFTFAIGTLAASKPSPGAAL